MRYLLLTALVVVFFSYGCKTSKIVQAPQPVEEPVETTTITEYRDLDTLVVTAPKPDKLKKPEEFKLPRYNPSYKRSNDLLHTKLELSFNWAEEQVNGKATLSFKPVFYPVNELVLDAKGFDIHQLSLAGQTEQLKYSYDGQQLIIELGKTFDRSDSYDIYIDYTASPTAGPIDGSEAITSDQGLFFINSDGSQPNKPMQIWTQGETEHNSRWFPTIDKPNERCTQEMYLTVQDRFKTLSNGLLLSSTKNPDGTRTDYWKMDQPHAPYLFMVAIGEYAVVADKWKEITVDYYVEPDYEEHARDIFSNTVEMLDFFSEKLKMDYPWQKYSQVVVRDYVSGAMENTTGVIFGEFVQKTKRELIDNHNERIIAHELFHHWFGDLVTCESWANLTMNEGFANYSEYLWFEHKYGKDEADFHWFNELQGYLGSAQQEGIHPLIHFGHEDKEDMFDAHSYNKGGLVMHMLRNYVGDEAFWAGLNLYLEENKYTSVEAHDLRLAFEEVCGEDLNWFFNQWFFNSGHPELNIEYSFNDQTSSIEVLVEQTQNTDRMPAIFVLPFAIDIYLSNGQTIRKEVTMDQRSQNFIFQVPERPKLVNLDADKYLLVEKTENKTEEEYLFQFQNAPHFLDQFEALNALENNPSPNSKKIFAEALKNDFWFIRYRSLQNLEPNGEILESISDLAKNDPHSQVKALAIDKLGASGDKKYIELVKNTLKSEKAYPVISSSLNALNAFDPATALDLAKSLENEKHLSIIMTLGAIYGESGKLENLDYFESNWNTPDYYDALAFIGSYLNLAKTGEGSTIDNSLLKLRDLAVNMEQSPWRRLAATKAIADLANEYSGQINKATETHEKTRLQQKVAYLMALVSEIIRKEENDQLKAIYQQFQ